MYNFQLSALIILILHVIYAHCGIHEFGGNTYFISKPIKKNWFQAYKYCNEKKMELLFIESKEENDYITNLMRSTFEYSRPGSNYWIGATDLGSDRDWYWLSTGKHVDYANWAKHEPTMGEHCVHLWVAHNFLWNNIACTFQAYFICKAKPCSHGFTLEST